MNPVVQELNKVLADTYVLYFKTHGFHWNVVGPQFPRYHEMFEEQYQSLWEALDEIAERIRSVGAPAPMNSSSLVPLASLSEAKGALTAQQMVKELAENHKAIAKVIRGAIAVSNSASDEVTTDMLTTRLADHEKTAWMLSATAEG